VVRRAVFLDCDGTLNIEKGYLYRFEDWGWIPGAVEAIQRINKMRYLAIVVTNQAGIARGYYAGSAVHALHKKVGCMLDLAKATIDAYHFCPHHPEHGEERQSTCRKPKPGMLCQAQRDYDVDLRQSWLIGDRLTDIEAGLRAGVSPILVPTGYWEQENALAYPGLCCEADVLTAVRYSESNCPREVCF
jgi:D-glycero-D-manno-heptose 1,7-bisphosphate phosphatase